MFEESTVIEKIKLAELDKDKKYIMFVRYGKRPSSNVLVSHAEQLENLLNQLDINNVIIAPEVESEIEYNIVESE